MSSGTCQDRGEDSLRGIASREVRRFIADIIEVAGGPGSVALELERLGYFGGEGPFSEQSIRTWGTGTLTPGSDLLFALARYYDLSLDEYAFGETEDGRRETMLGFQERRRRLREALRTALQELVELDAGPETAPCAGPGRAGSARP